jgi:uncharacterized repeat protein (TIGR01451 family)
MLALVAAGLMMCASPRAGAQGFGLSVAPSATSVLVSNSLTYTINLTNLAAPPLTDVQVTNLLPSSVKILSTNASQGSITVSSNTAVFDLGGFNIGAIAQLSLTVQPTAAGFITNMVTVAPAGLTNIITNVVVQVTNAPIVTADLGVMISGPAQPVITNDWMTFGVAVTNAGPDAASGVMLTNTLPPGVGYKSVSPASPAPSVAGSNVIFNLGTLASGAFTNFVLTVQPTNAGSLLFSAFVSSTGATDINPTNNSASTNITVTNYLSELLVAVTNSGQNVDLQNGLEEQSVLLTNASSDDVPAARIVVTGLTNQLFNAVGTNNGSPFVDLSAGLAAGHHVNLLLQYFPRKSFPFTNGQLHAFALPAVPDWTPPAAAPAGTNVSINRIVRMSNGNMLIEWFAVTNRNYTVAYSDNVSFSNAMMAPPSISIVAPGNEVQWIDYGPPTTASAPTNTPVRFYRVFLNP